MSKTYLLPCRCGEQLEVEGSQAGEDLQCSCGNQLEVPTLRGLSELQVVEAADSGPRWTQAQGVLTVLGILLLVGGAVAGYLIFQSIPNRQLAGMPGTAADLDSRLGNLNATETLQIWKFYRDKPDLMIALPDAIAANQQTRLIRTIGTCVSGAVCLIGGLGCILIAVRKPRRR